jgi:E3 ubiquitin-protein ligase makorin
MQNNFGKKITCKYFSVNGICPYGSRCWFLHENPIASADETSAVVEAETLDGEVKISAPIRPTEIADSHETELCCSICFENVSNTNGQLFGLVSGCDHCFCLSCLREWRYSKSNPSDATRQCPVCRVPITYVVPSAQFLTGEEKEATIKNYFEQMSHKPCKHFKGKPGTCPFGPECYYAHRNRYGEDMKPIDFKKKIRHPRPNIESIERDLILLTQLLHHRMNFPFTVFEDDDDGESNEFDDDVEDDDDYEEDASYFGFPDFVDDEEDEEYDDEELPPLIH